MGNRYAAMSMDPFGQNTGWYYRRILKPAIANLLQIDGIFLYYLFSLVCTYLLIFLTITFFESKVFHQENDDDQKIKIKTKFLYYLSIATTSYIITDFLWPGYVDHLSFILILLMAILPLNFQARLAIITLCMINHESSAFALFPIILFSFPKKEISKALLLIFLYLSIWFISHGGMNESLDIHSPDKSILQALIKNYGLAIAGIFFCYKLFWFLFLYVLWILWLEKDIPSLLAISSITLLTFVLVTLAWDTTRGVSYGFLGMLITMSILIDEYKNLSKITHRLILATISINILIPCYPVILDYFPSLSNYPYRGLYKVIHNMFISVFIH